MKSFEFYIDPKYIGKHFALSPSSHVMDRDRTEQELHDLMYSKYAKDIGTALHELAADYISHHIRPSSKGALYDAITLKLCQKDIPRSLIDPDRYLITLMMYIRDALSFDMTPEVPLVYSPVAGGTTDAISFNLKKRYLRIHDLKTGKMPAKMDQLAEYAALFCLCYKKHPDDLDGIELRIYQNEEAIIDHPGPKDIAPIMDRFVTESAFLMDHYGG